MDNNNKINMTEILMGSIFGSILGVTAGLLFTPQPGRKLREDINVTSKEGFKKLANGRIQFKRKA